MMIGTLIVISACLFLLAYELLPLWMNKGVSNTSSNKVIVSMSSSSATGSVITIIPMTAVSNATTSFDCVNSEATFCGSTTYLHWLTAQPITSIGLSDNFPVLWNEGGTQFQIEMVRYGPDFIGNNFPLGGGEVASIGIHIVNSQGQPYPSSSAFYVVEIDVKISSNDSIQTTTLAAPNVYRLVDESGDLVPPNGAGINLFGQYALQFVIPDNEVISDNETTSKYTFTTGGSSNIFFYVQPSDRMVSAEPTAD